MRVHLVSASLAIAAGLALAAAAAEPLLAAAPDAAAERALAKLQAWLDGTRDLRGRFEQHMVSGALGTGMVESGRLWLERPSRMRWDYRKPERKVAIVEGTSSRFWIEQDRQMWEGRLADADDALATLLLGREPLRAIFEVRLLAVEEEARDGARIALRPRRGSERFEEVSLTLDPADGSIRAAEVVDATGNRIEYRFFDLVRNGGVAAAVFEFTPPPGTEVVQVP